MRKILFLYHMEERELLPIKFVVEEMQKIDKNVEIEIKQFTPGCIFALEFMPDVIVSIPPRNELNSDLLTNVKLVTNAVIISATTEGLDDYVDEYSINCRIGFNSYPKQLVDYYIFWGEKASRILGDALLKTEKISNIKRIKTFGYVLYDKEKVGQYLSKNEKVNNIKEWAKKYSNIITIVTGFDKDNVTVEDRFEEGSIKNSANNNETRKKEIEIAKKAIEKNLYYRKQYVQMIINLATKNPDKGFIVKLHPGELSAMKDGNCSRYDVLRDYLNILLVDYPILIAAFLPFTSQLIHYGSTTALEAYCYHVPTIQLIAELGEERRFCYGKKMFESTSFVDIDAIDKVEKLISDNLEFTKIESIDNFLLDSFNFRDANTYSPTNDMAQFYLSDLDSQKLEFFDASVRETLLSKWGFMLRKRIYVKMIRNIVKLDFREYKKWKEKVKSILPDHHSVKQDFFDELIIKLGKIIRINRGKK